MQPNTYAPLPSQDQGVELNKFPSAPQHENYPPTQFVPHAQYVIQPGEYFTHGKKDDPENPSDPEWKVGLFEKCCTCDASCYMGWFCGCFVVSLINIEALARSFCC